METSGKEAPKTLIITVGFCLGLDCRANWPCRSLARLLPSRPTGGPQTAFLGWRRPWRSIVEHRGVARRAWTWLATALVALGGCAGGSPLLQGQQQYLQQQQQTLARQAEELQTRASSLDGANQKLEMQLAQAQQRGQVLEDQANMLREQLGGLTTQLARIREEKQSAEEKAQTLTASLQRQGSVTIEPNNSFLQTLPVINKPEVNVRRDGDVIRVELPSHRLFQPGTAQFLPEGVQLLSEVAAEMHRAYPGQMVGVEGHTDNDPVVGPFRNHNHLSTAWAVTVYDALQTHTKLQSQQLFVVGHGANHPVVSNATAAGKLRNRRVELVIYPDKAR